MKTDAELMAEVLATTANRYFAELIRDSTRPIPYAALKPMGPDSTLTDLAGAALALGCRVEVRVVPFGEA